MPDTSTASTSFALDSARRIELAQFLKSRRARISPARVGLKAGVRRRARGLLREEVAQLAGISPTWYVWLEQGRDIHPSRQVVAQLADALLMSEAERSHLFALAQSEDAPADLSTEATDVLRAFIAGLTNEPAYVVNGVWDLLAWNAAARDTFGDFSTLPESERNVLHLIFRWAPWRTLLVDHAQLMPAVAAQFRAETVRHAGHPRRAELVESLLASSPEFAALWNFGGVKASAMYEKRLLHPRRGLVTLNYGSLKPQGAAEDISVVVYSP